mgnify:CR=1 FL=1
MKTSRLIISAMIVVIALFLCSEIEVKAASTYNGKIKASEYVSKTYVKMVKTNGYAKYLQVQVIRRSTDNEFVYCIQPFVSVVDDTYKVTYDDYLSVMGMTEDQWERISLLAYYGYKYGNHTETKWYAITQVLIWRTMEPTVDIYFTSTLNGSKDNSIYQSEISELETLVSNHKKKPSFDIDLSNIKTINNIIKTDTYFPTMARILEELKNLPFEEIPTEEKRRRMKEKGVEPSWLDKVFEDEEVDEMTLKEFDDFKSFIEEFRNE